MILTVFIPLYYFYPAQREMKVAAISRKSSLFVLKGFLFYSFNAPGYEITSSPYELILTRIIPVSHVQIWRLDSTKMCNGMITQ